MIPFFFLCRDDSSAAEHSQRCCPLHYAIFSRRLGCCILGIFLLAGSCGAVTWIGLTYDPCTDTLCDYQVVCMVIGSVLLAIFLVLFVIYCSVTSSNYTYCCGEELSPNEKSHLLVA